jgi:hypothetical protein
MRVCHITTVHPADDARIFYRMCGGLTRRGVSVVLVAPSEVPNDSAVQMSPLNRQIAQALHEAWNNDPQADGLLRFYEQIQRK